MIQDRSTKRFQIDLSRNFSSNSKKMYREKFVLEKWREGIGRKIRKIDLFVDFLIMEWKEMENGNGREMGRE